MDKWQLWFVLLLPLHLCLNTNEILVKTIRGQTDVTPVCTRATLHLVTLIVCKIRTKRNGEECRLLYQHGRDFVRECDPRFTLMTENQSVYLHLNSLTPVDSGNITCECSHAHGTDTLQLIVTVEGARGAETSPIKKLISTAVIGSAAAFVTVTAVVLGLVLKKIYHRGDSRSGPSELSVCEPSSSNKHDADSTYASLRQPGDDCYQTISTTPNQHDGQATSAGNNTATVHLEQNMYRKETEQLYEVI